MNLIEKLKEMCSDIDVEMTIDNTCPSLFFENITDRCEVLDGSCWACWHQTYKPDYTIKLDTLRDPSASEAVKNIAEDITTSIPPTILDSGDRTEFETGAVRDMREGKGRCDLMPLDVVGRFYDQVKTKRLVETDSRSDVGSVFICISRFQHDGNVSWLYEALRWAQVFDKPETMFLEVAKHFEEGCKKYGEDNWRKGIPVKCYIDSAVRHYLKFLRGDKDEPHDRAFVWNILCCIWTSNRENSI